MDELSTNEVIVFGPAGRVAVGVTPSAYLTGNVAVGVASPSDIAGVVTAGVVSSADLDGDATVVVVPSADLVGDVTVCVASSADLAEDTTVGVASSAIAEMASSADIAEVAFSADLAGDIAVGVPSSADHASVVTAGVAFREECGFPGDYDEVFFYASVSYVEQCQERVGLLNNVCYRPIPTATDESFVALEVIVVGVVGSGAP